MDDNIFVSKNAVDFCHLKMNERSLRCPFGSGFKCFMTLNSPDIVFSNLRS